jgi:predicted PurR-regulated permease PerM
MLTDKPYTFDRTVRIIIALGIAVLAIWLLSYLSSVLIPFTSALVLTYMLNPMVKWFEKRIKYRIAAVALTLIIFLGSLCIAIILLVPVIASEVSNMSDMVSDFISTSELTKQISGLPDKVSEIVYSYFSQDEIRDFFSQDNLQKWIQQITERLIPGVWDLVSGTATLVSGLFGITVVLLYLLFMLIDYDELLGRWKELLPLKYKDYVLDFLSEFEGIMNRYFRGQALIALIDGIIFIIGFSIIGLPMGILLGIFIAVLVMVPYLHWLGLVPCLISCAVYSMETGNNIWIMIGLVLLIFFIVQVIQDLILVPNIMGKVTGMNPAMIILSISIWGKLMGFLGLILALPFTYLLLTYYKRYLVKLQMLQKQAIESPKTEKK